jgi:hypothetical protein
MRAWGNSPRTAISVSVPSASGKVQIHQRDARMTAKLIQCLHTVSRLATTKSMSGRDPTIVLGPSRKTGWSSTLRMRIGLGTAIVIPPIPLRVWEVYTPSLCCRNVRPHQPNTLRRTLASALLRNGE